MTKNGLAASAGYYIPRFTAERYPEFLSHFGLSNIPQRLSDVFKTPITWGEYCGVMNCSDPDDGVATRPPSDTRERNKYFVEGSYTGFFQDNQCDPNDVTACTGHLIDVDLCTWASVAENQFYWHNISLASAGPSHSNSGYSIGQVVDIVFAANATRSDVVSETLAEFEVHCCHNMSDPSLLHVFSCSCSIGFNQICSFLHFMELRWSSRESSSLLHPLSARQIVSNF